MIFNGRREDWRLLTGTGKYTADWNFPDQLHGFFLRSDHAHAEIVSIELEAARRSLGVVALFTGADTAGFGSAPQHMAMPGKDGMTVRVPKRAVLADARVRHVGQEIAFVVAATAHQAQDAAESIEVQYRDLPVLAEAPDALAPDAPQIHDGIPGNLCFDYEYGDEPQTTEAFSHAAHVVRITLDSQRLIGCPMEPKACVAAFDPQSGRYDIYVSTQGMSLMQAALSGMTGVPAQRIRVHAQDVGGSFGIRSDAYAEYCAAMLAARALGRPVKWVASRSETFLSDYHGRAASLTGELALDRDGILLGMRIQWVVNSGAYLTSTGPIINTLVPSFHAGNVYRIPALYGRHRLAFTNTTPTIAYRGAGRPNVAYLIERLMDEAARTMGIDRIDLRRRNLLSREDFPYRTPIPMSVYDSGDPPGLLEEVLRQAHWSKFGERRAEAPRRGRLRGIGCAIFIEPAGAGRAPKEEVAIRFDDSGRAVLYALAGPSGQGHETVFPEIVAGILGIDANSVTLRASDPDGPPLVGEGTMASRSLMAHGGAAVMAAREVVRKGTDLAAKDLEVAAEDIEFRDGRYHVKGTDVSIGMGEIATKHGRLLDSAGEIPLPWSYPSGAHVAEIEIDPETGALEICRYVAVTDCGRIINRVLVEGQMHGGIAQGIGQAMGEHAIYDRDTGQLLTGSFVDYELPRADGVPDMALHDRSTPTPGNPLGAKGIGESGTTGAVPVIANAVIDALRPLGIHHLDFPYTPQCIWRAIRAAKNAAPEESLSPPPQGSG